MKQAADGPIGIFDSGVGGLTIWDEIARRLPGEDTLYYADSIHAPYGERPAEAIRELSRNCTQWLLERGAKLVVVACNTATTNAIASLRAEFSVPFIGIEPAIKPAALNSKTGRIGVLATRGTLGSELFAGTSRLHARGIEIVEKEGRGLVEAVEAGAIRGPEVTALLSDLLKPMIRSRVDHLVLGCTHYPFLIPLMRELLPDTVRIIDCAAPVARQTREVLLQRGLLRENEGSPGQHRFFTSGDPAVLQRLLEALGGAGEVAAL